MKKGDIVKIKDGSYAVRVDKFEILPKIGLCKDDFEVIEEAPFHGHIVSEHTNALLHDIFIKNTKTGAIYLHSKAFCELVKSKTTHITMSEVFDILKKHFNCDNVKIIA
jgi:hypothetical protein